MSQYTVTETGDRIVRANIGGDGSVKVVSFVLIDGQWHAREALLNRDELARLLKCWKDHLPTQSPFDETMTLPEKVLERSGDDEIRSLKRFIAKLFGAAVE